MKLSFLNNHIIKILAIITIAFLFVSYYAYMLSIENSELSLSNTFLKAEIESNKSYIEDLQAGKEEVEMQIEELEAKNDTASKLEICIAEAQERWSSWGEEILAKAEDCKREGDGVCMAISVYSNALRENDADLQQDKDNCFKQYPQN